MAPRRKQSRVSKTTHHKPESIADLLTKLEMEAQKIVRVFIEKAEQSSHDIKKGVSSLIEQVRHEGFATVASEKREDLRRIADEVISRAKEVQFLSLGNLNRDEIIREAKKNLDELVSRINSSEFMLKIRERAVSTKDHLLSILRIPSQSEVAKLSRKISTLENRVTKLTRKAA